MLVDSCYLTKLHCTKTTSTVPSLSTISPSLLFSITFFELPNNCIVSSVDNSSLYPVFILKKILFFILFT